MSFKLITESDGSYESFTDDGSAYSFNQYGLLVVVTGDGTRRVYSPNAWRYVEDAPKARKKVKVFGVS